MIGPVCSILTSWSLQEKMKANKLPPNEEALSAVKKKLFSPKSDILDFYKEWGYDYTEWFNDSDRLFAFIEKQFPLIDTNDGSVDKYRRLIPASESPFNIYFIEKAIGELGIDINNFFRINSTGQRSDEFSKTHDGLHILFAGCSITFGDGMIEEYTWARKVYDEIQKTHKTSGYFNVAGPGFNHLDIYHQVFKYIELYGNPDYIFINFPDLNRLKDSGIEVDDFAKVLMPIHKSLELYANASGIKLIMFSWDEHCLLEGPWHNQHPNSNDIFYENRKSDPRTEFIDSFYRFSQDQRQQHMMRFIENNPDHQLKNFFMRGLDVVHPGVAEHDFYFRFAYDVWSGVVGLTKTNS